MRKILLPILALLLIGMSLSLDYKCTTKDGKTWDCSLPIERFFDETNDNIREVSTATGSSGTTMKVYGTDYFVGEPNATTFLQLLNSTNEPISNSSCFVSIWYPDKSAFILNGSMQYHTEGLFYYDYNLPTPQGIYMMSAKCTLPQLAESVNHTQVAFDDFGTGSFTGGTGWNDDWDTFGEFVSVSSAQSYSPSYSGLMTKLGAIGRSVDLTNFKNVTISFWYYLQSIDANEYTYFKINDGTTRTIRTWDSDDDDATWHNFNHTFEEGTFNPTCNFVLWFNILGDSNADYFYVDDVNVTGWKYGYEEVIGYEYQEIRGSGEIHIINTFNTSYYPSKTGEYYNQICLDNSTLQMNYTTEYCYGSSCYNYTTTEAKPCICDNDTCETPFNWLLVAGFGLGISVLAFLLRRRFLSRY